MARSRASAKKAGTAFETDVCNYLKVHTGFTVIRMPKTGAADRGDIFGVSLHGKDVVVECKAPGEASKWTLSGWWKETLVEKANFSAEAGVLMVKKFRKPISEAYCILNVAEAQRFGIDTDALPVTKTRGTTNWRTIVQQDSIYKFPMVGKPDFWIVMCLEKFTQYIDRKAESTTITLTPLEVQQLLENQHLCAYTTEGDQVEISILD